MLSDTLLFTGNANPALAREIAADLGLELGKAAVGHFSDGEVTVEIQQNVRVLNDAAGYLRMLLGKAMKLRSVPQLHFHYDESITRGTHLSALIERAISEDSKHQDD